MARRNDVRRGHLKGQPIRFVHGHGNRGRRHTEATRQKMRKPKSAQMRARLSAARKGRKNSPEHCEAMRRANLGKKLSLEHRAKVSASLRGKTGPLNRNWKGGVTRASQLARNTPEYKQWARAVKVRDNFTCRGCGARGGTLHSHHVLPFSTRPELRTAVENGVTLCARCHAAAHRIARSR